MKLHHLKRSQFVARPLNDVFAFFEQPENLVRITPPSMGFEILTPPPIKMCAGALIDYTIRLLGFRTRWTTMITDYEPPRLFVDVQLKGPYTYWHHTHSFQEEDGGTRLLDHVQYLMLLGYLGQVIHVLLVRKQLDRIIDYRARIIQSLFV